MVDMGAQPREGARVRDGSRGGRVVGGLTLLLPLLGLWVAALLAPTVRTLWLSGQNVRLLRDDEWIGLANYRRIVGDATFAAAGGFTALLVVERVLIVALVPPLLALAVGQFGRGVRVPLRLFFTVPLALFAPTATALTWRLAYSPAGLFGGGSSPLASATAARGAFLRMDALVTFGLACGVGLIVYLLALRGAGDAAPTGRRVAPPLAIVWLVTIMATVALALQSFTPGTVLTGGGPLRRTTTLGMLAFNYSFQNLQLGLGAALATLIALVPALLGVVTAIVVAASGLRLVVVPPRKPHGFLAASARPLAALGLVLLGGGCLVALVYGLLPTIWVGFTSLKPVAEAVRSRGSFLPEAPTLAAYDRLAQVAPGGRTFANTVLPVAVSVFLIQLPIAWLGALGIGALRPLGRYSEWLLLPFSPWLFITALPLGVANYERLVAAGLINSFAGLIPPPTLTVPLLFILTLGFRGGAGDWSAARAGGVQGDSFARLVLLPSLPLTALLGIAALLLGVRELFWPTIVANDAQWRTIPTVLAQLGGRFATDPPLLAAAIWRFGLPLFVVAFFLLAVFQIAYLDRLALATGPDEPPAALEAER